MKIAYVSDCYWPRVNGVSVSVQTFAESLRARGHEVLIFCPRYPDDGLYVDKPHLMRLSSVRSFFSKEDRSTHPLAFAEMLPELDAFAPDVIHVQTEFAFGNLGRVYAKLRGYPVVSTCHTHWEEYFEHYVPAVPSRVTRAAARAVMKSAYRRDAEIVVPTQRIARVLRDYGIRKPLTLIPTGVDPDFFVADPGRDERVLGDLLKRFPRLERGPRLLFVGRIGQEKNIEFLFPVLKSILSRHPQASLLLVGDGAQRPSIQRAAEEAGLGDVCLFAGFLPREDLPSVYAAVDVFVFPSKTETQGLVTIEAMACGTPVVAIGEMGTADVMAGDNGGFMVKDDPHEFASRVLDLLDDPGLRAAKAAEAQDYARGWTSEKMTDRLLAVYERAAAKRKPPAGLRAAAARARAIAQGLIPGKKAP